MSQTLGHRKDSHIREYYGFVLYLTSFIVLALYLLWMFIPDPIWESMGIYYYPNKYWGLAVPLWILMLIPFTLAAYTGINLVRTDPLDSFNTVSDEHQNLFELSSEPDRRKVLDFLDPSAAQSLGVPRLQDIPVSLVNKTLYD
ncbi:PIG-P [Polychytrium aggregatum]|uniref:PIG-P n=1 Tax=Polychytrium aggregatum TaxID=110093 RepID=UPI0022FDB866|nr:PIG-P [Polychytrium aggregatum]KAI9205091.1 PIG-P [Polychytrium aggregatum]